MAGASTYAANLEVTTTTVNTFTIAVAADGKSLTVTETTGIAGASAWSPGGDAVIGNLTEAFLRVTTPAGVDYDVDVSASLPGGSGTGSLTFTQADMYLASDGTTVAGAATDVFPDGMYAFRLLYKITGLTPNDPGFIPPTVVNGAALSISEGYVHGLLAKLKPGCTCKSADFETAKLAYVYLKAAAYSAICDKPDKVNDYVNQIAKLTGNTTGCISC